ncbi:hypothetical protein ACFLZG_07895, partial [Thermodesulfobacteriota bacterium]
GREISRETLVCKGTPDNPMSHEQFEEKYRDCSSLTLDDKGVERSFEQLTNLEAVEDIRELMTIVTKT